MDGSLAPVVVEPPEGEPTCHPFREPLPPELGFFGGRLQPTFVPGGDRERVVVEVRTEVLALQVPVL